MNKIKISIAVSFLISCSFTNYLYSAEVSQNHASTINNENILQSSTKVEIGIESILKEGDDYIISVYAINPFDEIAGIQFKILKEDLFNIESVYGGKTSDKDFSMHFNKKGTILGFSMVGETIERTSTSSHKDKKIKNILFYAKAKANRLIEYLNNSNETLQMETILASKSGKTLSSKFIPFNLSNIK